MHERFQIGETAIVCSPGCAEDGEEVIIDGPLELQTDGINPGTREACGACWVHKVIVNDPAKFGVPPGMDVFCRYEYLRKRPKPHAHPEHYPDQFAPADPNGFWVKLTQLHALKVEWKP